MVPTLRTVQLSNVIDFTGRSAGQFWRVGGFRRAFRRSTPLLRQAAVVRRRRRRGRAADQRAVDQLDAAIGDRALALLGHALALAEPPAEGGVAHRVERVAP